MARRLALLLVLSSLLLQTSCVDLSAIRKFTDTANDAGQHFPALANDYYRSCMQENYYAAMRKGAFRDQFDPVIVGSFTRAINDPSDPNIVRGPATNAIAKCVPYRNDQEKLIEANKVLVNYLRTMGQLAADDLTSYDKSIDGLDKGFVASKFLKQDAADAVTKLAGAVIHAVTEGYRRKKLETIIGEYNGDVRKLSFGLQTAIDVYITQLRKERGAMNDYYSDSIQRYAAFADYQVRPRKSEDVQRPPPNPLPILPLKERWDADQMTIKTKLDAAESYRQLLTNIADGHQALYANRKRLDAKDVLQTALNYANTSEDLVAAFKKAF